MPALKASDISGISRHFSCLFSKTYIVVLFRSASVSHFKRVPFSYIFKEITLQKCLVEERAILGAMLRKYILLFYFSSTEHVLVSVHFIQGYSGSDGSLPSSNGGQKILVPGLTLPNRVSN